ncbi:MAG: lipid II flippase MurJ [Opitutales bacterium]
MARRFRNISVVAGSTIASRILGLVRDVLIYGVLGTSVFNSAFILAFTLPNLFRRLLGEGALTSALIPVLSDAWARDPDAPSGFRLLNQVLTRLGGVLLGLTLLGMGLLSLVAELVPEANRWQLGARYGLLLFPFVGLVCVAALFAAALNARNRFAVPALNPVFLNLCMISGLLLGGLAVGGVLDQRVIWLSMAVLLGGVIQVGVSAWALWRDGWRPAIAPETSPAIREVWLVFLSVWPEQRSCR